MPPHLEGRPRPPLKAHLWPSLSHHTNLYPRRLWLLSIGAGKVGSRASHCSGYHHPCMIPFSFCSTALFFSPVVYIFTFVSSIAVYFRRFLLWLWTLITKLRIVNHDAIYEDFPIFFPSWSAHNAGASTVFRSCPAHRLEPLSYCALKILGHGFESRVFIFCLRCMKQQSKIWFLAVRRGGIIYMSW